MGLRMMPADRAGRSKKRRVLVLFPHMVTAGGALNYTLRLSEQLLAHECEVAILTLRANPKDFALPAAVEVISLEGPLTSSLGYWLFFPYWQWKINKAIITWGADVLVPQVFPANWWGWLYKRKHPGIKLVWICHEPSAFIHSLAWIRAIRPWWKSLLARTLRPVLTTIDISLVPHCDKIIANSHFTAKEIMRVYGIAADGIACPGIDSLAFAGESRPQERAIITVARLTKFKRLDFLLEVFREVLKSHPDIIYNIVGTGEEEVPLRNQVKRLGLESRVIFHGGVDSGMLVRLYQRSNLFLHGSVDEPFGMAPLEAIASGAPVVAHRSGGPMEFVDENCGRLIDSLEVQVWATEISQYLDILADDGNSANQVRECARRFDWQHSLQPGLETIGLLCAEKNSSQTQA
jgi:glycosyltransferase involved in cell wall biosynthesis